MQRAMDLGAAGGLSGALVWKEDGSSSGHMWVRLRIQASMNPHYYNAYVKLAVVRIAGTRSFEAPDDCDSEAEDEESDSDISVVDGGEEIWRLLATRVLAALCKCKAGRKELCHYVCMILQLMRLLHMSIREVNDFNPVTPTGRPCQWILNHCRGGREAAENTWWGMVLPEMAEKSRQIRDPRGQEGFGEYTPVDTRGVVKGNRQDFVPYPAGGVWAERHKHHVDGRSISLVEKATFDVLPDAVRSTKQRRGRRSLATDVLPPLVRRLDINT
ncbi:unnamed protein product [Pylaiella littoralis]